MAGMISFRLGSTYLNRLDALAMRLEVNRAQLIRNLLSGDPIRINMITETAKTIEHVTIHELVAKNSKKNVDAKWDVSISSVLTTSEDIKNPSDLITIRMDDILVQRFDALAVSLGVSRVQVLRTLLSLNPILVDGVAAKAKALVQIVKKMELEKPVRVIADAKLPSIPHEKKRQPTKPLEDVKEPVNTLNDEIQDRTEMAKSLFVILPSSASLEESRDERLSKHTNEKENDNLFPGLSEGAEQTADKPTKGRKKKESTANDHSEARKEIIDYLNQKTGKKFGLDNIESIASLNSMLEKGHNVDEFKIIIDNMVPVWIDNPKMYVRLNPVTLFRQKHFEYYLNGNRANISAGDLKKPLESIISKPTPGKYDSFYL